MSGDDHFLKPDNDVAQAESADPRACTCHPDDNPPQPCPRKYALTHCRAAAIASNLREAMAGADDDDMGAMDAGARLRHVERLDVMMRAAEFLEERY